MILQDSRDGDVAIIEMGGRLKYCIELRLFQEKIRSYLDQGVRLFVIDLQNAESTGSEGLGALIAGYTTVTKANGKFVLANVSELHNLLTMTKLYHVFEAYPTRADAVWAVRHAGAPV